MPSLVSSAEVPIPGEGRANPGGEAAPRPAIPVFRPFRVVAVVLGLLIPLGSGRESRAADGTLPEADGPVDPAKRAKYD